MFPIRDDAPRYSTPYVTYFIIALNVLGFVFELSLGLNSRAFKGLIYQFGVVPRRFELALSGAPNYSLPALSLTVLTSMFLHGGWLHIIGNMWFLRIFGDNVEDYLGHLKYLLFYLLSGCAAGVAYILLDASSNQPTIGASGAIAGVMGAYFLLYPKARVLTLVFLIVFVTFWWLPAWVFLGYWFVLQFLSGTATSLGGAQNTGGIAFWAHVGGFVAGILLIKLLPERPRRYRYASW